MGENPNWRRRLFGKPVEIPAVRHVANEDGTHDVEVAIRVWVYEQGGAWVAQGLDVNYVAAGESAEDAAERFAKGFMETVAAYLQEFNSIEEFVKPAPREVFQAFLNTQKAASSRRRLKDAPPALPGFVEFLRSESPASCPV